MAESETRLEVELRRLLAESDAEQDKLRAESKKLDAEARWLVLLAMIGNAALAAIIGAVVARL